MSECYSHHIKLGLQRGAKLELAASQTKTTWKNVRHYMCLGYSTCMDYCRERNYKAYINRGSAVIKKVELSLGKLLMFIENASLCFAKLNITINNKRKYVQSLSTREFTKWSNLS